MAADKDILQALASLQASMKDIQGKFNTIPNREDFEKMDNNVNSMKKEIAVNSDRLDAISKQQEADKKDFVRNVERVIDARMAYHKTTRSGVNYLAQSERG